jgi:predicted acylesterase/phospholipase RssA
VGLTLIQRSEGRKLPTHPKIGLVLAGGAVTGGAFKVGGLKALDEFLVSHKVTEFDIYVGLSAGAFLATSLSGGITPDEMIEALEGTSDKLDQLRPIDFYSPNIGEVIGRSAVFSARLAAYIPGLVLDLVSVLPELPARLGPSLREVLRRPTYSHLESFLMELFLEVSPKRQFPPLSALLPSGMFDNAPLERWLASNMRRVGMSNHFAQHYRESGRRLHLSAMNLDTAERVTFGPENDHGLSISEAVQASSALPGFFKPVRLGGVDYVDGGVPRTANVDVAVDQGADLIICYNPFRPFFNRTDRGGRRRHFLSSRGFTTVINQVFRTLLHSRLALSLQTYQHASNFRGDIVVIEANETDEQFFGLNPLTFWKRSDAVRHGFQAVRQMLAESGEVLEPIFERYGVEFRVPADLAEPAPEEPGLELSRPALRVVPGAAG